MTSLKVVVLKILVLQHVVGRQSASINQCIPQGYVNCSGSTGHVTCHEGYFGFGPKTVRCINGTVEDWKLPKCVGVRLVGGSVNGTSGRVELEVNGTRGSVSDFYSGKRWSLTEATVVCRMVGFAKASFAIARFKTPDPPSVCLLQDVKCKGNESSISQCSHSGLKRSSRWYCSTHTAGVVCGSPKISFRIRSFSETIRSSGVVEVSVDGVWSALSYQGWTLAAGNVACRMFGLPNAVSIPESSGILGHTGLEWFRVKHCFGNESSLVDCSLDVVESSSSRTSEAGVICGQPKVSFRITRFSRKGNTSGRIEVSIDGIWSALSYKGWTLAAANVACRMFGLPNATSIPESSGILGRFGQELLRVKHCFGNESSLVNCSLDILKSSPVDSNGEAGVICGQPKVSVHLLEYASADTSQGKSVIGKVMLEIEGFQAGIGTTNWDDRAAKVMCRMLNMTGPHFKVTSSRYAYGYIAFWRIWMNKVKCSGNERSILDCDHPGLRNQHHKVLFSSSTVDVGCGKPEISLRLTGGRNHQEGNVEAYINGVMGFPGIVNNENKHNVSNVICRTLGLPPPSLLGGATKFVMGIKHFFEIHPICTGDERNISECKMKINVVHSRHSGWLHGISCSTGYECPLGCTCNLDFKEVGCINSNLTETMDSLPIFVITLSLVNNGEKRVMEERHLLQLPIQLAVLEIKGYEIHQLKRKYFVKLARLERLFLYQNNIKNIESWIISRWNMDTIDIQNNSITRLRKHAFFGVVGCGALILANNSIKVLEPEIFGLFFSMVFEGNQISTIESRTFFSYNLPEEKIMDRLSDEEQLSLSSLTNRTISIYLSLERNRIATIKPSAVGAGISFGHYISYLKILILTENLISKLNKTVFAGLPLEVLFLNRNPLEVIEEGVFNGHKDLKTLNLKDTRLQQLSSGLTPPHTSIHVYKSQSPLVIACNRYSAKFYYERGYKYHRRRDLCETCVLGSYKVGTRDGTCVKCPAGGFYQDEEAQYTILSHGLGCKQCPPGSFVPEEQAPGKDPAECQACPEGTRRNLPAMFRACSCLDDHYRVHRFQKCMPCDEGYQCGNESVNLLPGYYWKWSSPDAKHLYTNFTAQLQVRNNTHDKNLTSYRLGIPKAYACPVAQACKGGLDSECSLGYEGPLCAVCSKGFYMLASTCRKCPSLPWIIAQVVLILFIVAGLLAFMIKEMKNQSNKRSLSDAMTARLKIVLGFFQVTSGTISGFSYIKWPDVMISAIRYAELLQMNLLQIAPPQCLSRSLKTDLHVKLVLTMACNGAAVILGLLYYYIQTRCKSRNGQENDDVHSAAQQKGFRAVFLILFISYPLTSSHIFMVLPEGCHKICTATDETICNYYLKSDYTVRCDSQRFFLFSIFARVLLVYPVGFPLLVLYLLWKHYYRKSDPKKKVQATNGIAVGLRFLYENYAEDVWYWEIIELVRKVILTSVILLLDAGSRFSIGIIAMISGLYSISFAYFKPMTDDFEHWLQLTSLLATLVNMIVGILLVAQATGEALDGAMIKVLLMGANVAVVTIMAARYLIALGQTFFAIKRNPHCSLSCCLYLFLTLNEAGNEMAGVDTSSKGLRRHQNLVAHNIGAPQLDLSPAGLSVELEEEDLS